MCESVIDRAQNTEKERGFIQPAREGPLRAESARAVTGRRCPHSGKWEDFLTGQLNFVYGNSCNSVTESQKIVPKVGN